MPDSTIIEFGSSAPSPAVVIRNRPPNERQRAKLGTRIFGSVRSIRPLSGTPMGVSGRLGWSPMFDFASTAPHHPISALVAFVALIAAMPFGAYRATRHLRPEYRKDR